MDTYNRIQRPITLNKSIWWKAILTFEEEVNTVQILSGNFVFHFITPELFSQYFWPPVCCKHYSCNLQLVFEYVHDANTVSYICPLILLNLALNYEERSLSIARGSVHSARQLARSCPHAPAMLAIAHKFNIYKSVNNLS